MKCGVGDYTAQLAEALGKLSNTAVAVLTRKEGGPCKPENTVEVFPVIRRWDLSEFFQIASIVKRWRPDIIHFQFPAQGYRGVLPVLLPGLLSLFRAQIVQTWHEYFTKENIDCGVLPLLISPGNIIVVRPEYKSHMPPLYQWLIRCKQFRFIPNASSIPRMRLTDEERTTIRGQFIRSDKSLIVYFGFLYPHKGADLLFEIADPVKHHVVVIGDMRDTDPYHTSLKNRMQHYPWTGNATATGFLPAANVGKILAAADAVVLPFRGGGGMWNTSLHGAAIQGTFVVTTSREQHGYDAVKNIYYARPEDIEDMRQALDLYLGRRNTETNISKFATWDSIASEHISFYQSLLT